MEIVAGGSCFRNVHQPTSPTHPSANSKGQTSHLDIFHLQEERETSYFPMVYAIITPILAVYQLSPLVKHIPDPGTRKSYLLYTYVH